MVHMQLGTSGRGLAAHLVGLGLLVYVRLVWDEQNQVSSRVSGRGPAQVRRIFCVVGALGAPPQCWRKGIGQLGGKCEPLCTFVHTKVCLQLYGATFQQ